MKGDKIKTTERMILVCKVELYNEDAFEVLARMESNSVDLILTDPPYGIFGSSRPIRRFSSTVREPGINWDNMPNINKMLTEFKRVLRVNGKAVIFSDWRMADVILNESGSKTLHYNYPMIWDKGRFANNLAVGKSPGSYFEVLNVLTCKKKGDKELSVFNVPIDSTHVPNILRFKGDMYDVDVKSPYKKVHPTQKPVDLLEYLIRVYSNPGDVVVDPFMGSGSTGEACIRQGREFIGTDLTEEYYNVTKDRLEWVKEQLVDIIA